MLLFGSYGAMGKYFNVIFLYSSCCVHINLQKCFLAMFKTKTIMVNEHDEILWYMRSILRMRNTRYYALRKTCKKINYSSSTDFIHSHQLNSANLLIM